MIPEVVVPQMPSVFRSYFIHTECVCVCLTVSVVTPGECDSAVSCIYSPNFHITELTTWRLRAASWAAVSGKARKPPTGGMESTTYILLYDKAPKSSKSRSNMVQRSILAFHRFIILSSFVHSLFKFLFLRRFEIGCILNLRHISAASPPG